MLNLSAYIPVLLHRYDCVVIPDLGGFVANYSPARLDRSRGVIYPPSKGILFNKNLDRNDGLLVSEIAATEVIPYQEAMERITAFVNASKAELSQGGRIELEGLGYLYFDNERNIQYLPHQTVNFLNDSFGLSPVMAVPVRKAEAVEAKKTVELNPVKEEKTVEVLKEVVESKEAKIIAIQEAPKKEKVSRKKYYWAAAVVLPLLFYSYWLPFRTPILTTGHFSWTYLNPFGQYASPVYQERTATLSDSTIVLAQNEQHVPEVKLPTVEYQEPASETTYVPHPLSTGDMHYHIIAGCFINYDNALTQIEELKASGNQPYLFGQANGFYRVAVGSYTNEAEAVARLQAIRQGGQPNAWLLEE